MTADIEEDWGRGPRWGIRWVLFLGRLGDWVFYNVYAARFLRALVGCITFLFLSVGWLNISDEDLCIEDWETMVLGNEIFFPVFRLG